MDLKLINVGRVANDGRGDDLREANTKTNANITAIGAAIDDVQSAARSALEKADAAIASGLLRRIATVAIPPSTVVVGIGDGILPVNIADPSHQGLVLGIVKDGVAAGVEAVVQQLGDLDGVTGTFGAGDTLYPAADGTLTAIVPTGPAAAWLQIVATASTGSRINIAIGQAFAIGAGSALVLGSGSFAIVSDLGRAFVEATPLAVVAALLSILDVLPPLPDDPANYPAGGGLFRNGDTNGWTLTRILPKV